MEPWMSTQSVVLKLSALSLSVMVAWLVTTYLTDGVILDAFVSGWALVEWIKTKVCGGSSSGSSGTGSRVSGWKGDRSTSSSSSTSFRVVKGSSSSGLPTLHSGGGKGGDYRTARCGSSDGEATSFLDHIPKSLRPSKGGASPKGGSSSSTTAASSVTFMEIEADRVV